MQNQNPAIQRAQLLFHQRRYDLAANALREALTLSPTDARAHALLALCLTRQQKFQEATDAAQTAIVHEPDYPFAHYALAATLFDRNRFPEAEAAARESVRLDPENTDYWTLLGMSLFNQSRWADALDAADHGLHFDAEHAGAINLRAMSLVKLGRKEEAAHSIAGALHRNPDNAFSHANQGWTALHRNDHRQALEHFREALRLDPNNQWAREGMIAALKSRYFLYRIMLRYYLWMSTFRKRGQWFITIGLWVGYEILLQVQQSSPTLAPYIIPLLVLYVLFAWSTWVADPLFNFTLLLNKFGRHLLDRQRIIGAILVVAGGLFGIFLALLALITGHDGFFVFALFAAAITLSIATVSRCPTNASLWTMTAYTALFTLLGLAAIPLLPFNKDLAFNLFEFSIIALFLSGLAANLLLSRLPRR
jgi:tetratricopeptide (TPR) repeat protein